MLGHDAQLTETNGGNWIPLCECGWVGTVHVASPSGKAKTKRAQYVVDITKAAALGEHAQHCTDERERIAVEHAAALDAHAQYVELVRPTLTRRGRWGSG